ncbi:nitrate reductase [Mesorhizobium sp. Root157]|nr:nitrate reductase [Mesorhizobium sp. Root157]
MAASMLALAGIFAPDAISVTHRSPAQLLGEPETVAIAPGSFEFRLPGEFLKNDYPVDAPLQTTAMRRGFAIMKYQVSAADYARCVADGACEAPDVVTATAGDAMPLTGVSYRDATAYAAWLSERTGSVWRLPTDAEWAYAAADRYADDALLLAADGSNPAERWLARYRSEADRTGPDPQPKPRGHFGANAKGVADIAGNVWEWTTTCYTRTRLADGVAQTESTDNCGVRIVGGRHRGYMSYFIRDGKSGGCAAGMAPDNLGIRLVREPDSLLTRLKKLLPARIA